MKLACLITRLEHSLNPMDLFSMYITDWTPYIKYNNGRTPCQVVLFNSPHKQLVLYGWRPHQSFSINTTSTVYSKVLSGHCSTSILYPTYQHILYKTLLPHQMTTIPPFSKAQFETNTQSATLHLILT